MSDTPRTKAATRMAFTSEHMVEIEEAQKMERDLADMTKQSDDLGEHIEANHRIGLIRERELSDALTAIAMLGDRHERDLADMTKQRDELAEALKSLCRAIISEETLGITGLLKRSEAALAATKGGSHE